MEENPPSELEVAHRKIANLESPVDRLKEVILRVAWELAHKSGHGYLTEKEELFLKDRRRL
jgi:hypothetical protein